MIEQSRKSSWDEGFITQRRNIIIQRSLRIVVQSLQISCFDSIFLWSLIIKILKIIHILSYTILYYNVTIQASALGSGPCNGNVWQIPTLNQEDHINRNIKDLEEVCSMCIGLMNKGAEQQDTKQLLEIRYFE